MALPQKGAWARRYSQPYTGALAWGTGINLVHGQYGSEPLRLRPIPPWQGDVSHVGRAEHQAPAEAVPQAYIPAELFGYTLEDSTYTDLERDDRPGWDVLPEDNPSRRTSEGQPPWNATGASKERFRAVKGGAYSIWQYVNGMKQPPAITETVSEGWRNKPKGSPANAKPSDPSQYEIQTSMMQRYQTRNNRLAVNRGTDPARAPIGSRVVGQKLKVYSGERRHYDMFPFQQDEIPRPFYYRTAGTGRQEWLEANEQYDIAAIERTPPQDPYIGEPETSIGYGYTSEDYFYA